MTKLDHQYPRAGEKCRFTLDTGATFEGYYDHGGAYNQQYIFSSDGQHLTFTKTKEKPLNFSNIISWEYIK